MCDFFDFDFSFFFLYILPGICQVVSFKRMERIYFGFQTHFVYSWAVHPTRNLIQQNERTNQKKKKKKKNCEQISHRDWLRFVIHKNQK